MRNADLYPNLDQYLAGTGPVEDVLRPKGLDFWLHWLGVATCVWVLTEFGWLWWLLSFAILMAAMNWRAKLRHKGKDLPRALEEAARKQLPTRIKLLLRKGKLAGVIGETGAAALERCATLAVRARADMDRACGVPGSGSDCAELRQEIRTGIAGTMDHAFAAFEKRLISPKSMPTTDLLTIVEAERELQLLSSAVAAWASSILVASKQPEFSRIREQLRLIREIRPMYQPPNPAGEDTPTEEPSRVPD